MEGLTKERGRKSDIEERSCKWEGTSKKDRTITQFGCKCKYEERKKGRKKERKKERKEKRQKRIKAGLKGKYGREVEFM